MSPTTVRRGRIYDRQTLRTLRQMFKNMRTRCFTKGTRYWKDYGGRGITICHEWLNNRLSFVKWAVDNDWCPGLEIDRIDNDGNYEPSNCRFLALKSNCRNQRRTIRLTAFSETKPLQEWAEDPRCCISSACLDGRIRNGISAEIAITTPSGSLPRNPGHSCVTLTINGETRFVREWLEINGISRACYKSRIHQKWPREKAATTPRQKAGRKKATPKVEISLDVV